MSPKIQYGIYELESLFQSFFDSFNRDTPIQGDAVLDSLTSALGLSFNPCQRFWKSRTLKENAFHDVITTFNDEDSDEDSGQPPPEKGCLKIYDAYTRSQRTLAAVSQGVLEGMLYNDDDFFDRVTGRMAFVELEEYYVYGRICLESSFIFSTPPHPQVTIITIQPQQGPPDKLVLTELYSLVYWALRYAKRGKKFTSLPLRLVSICDTKARVLSANFSHGFLKYLATRKDDGKGLPMTVDVDIGPYFDMSQKEELLRFMRKIADVPISPPMYDS